MSTSESRTEMGESVSREQVACLEGPTGGAEYIFSKKYSEIRSEVVVLEYIGNNIFIDESGKKYLYESDNNKESLFVLDEITGEKSYEVS